MDDRELLVVMSDALTGSTELLEMRRQEYRMLVELLKEHWARIEVLESALAGLVRYTDDMVAGDSPEQIAARSALSSGKGDET